MTNDDHPHRTWAELNLTALRHNLGVAQRCAGPEGGVMAVVKADAYGLGARWLVPELEKAGAACFAVATLDEARELHALGVVRPVYLLSPALPGERATVVAADFPVIPAVCGFEDAASFSALAVAAGKTQPVHLVLDTGMGRVGLLSGGVHERAEVVEEAKRIAQLPGLTLDSVGSHFPSADEDAAYTTEQLSRYREVLAALAAAGVQPAWQHVANSSGALSQPRLGRELIRAGLMLYGVSPLPEKQVELRDVVVWKACVGLVRTLPAGHGVSYGRTFITERPTRLATLAVGYADGYPRHLSGQGAWVWLGGQRCPVLGRVTMDQIMVEAPAGTQPGDVATLLGGDGPSAAELSKRAGTIAYELFCGLGRRVVRVTSR